MDIGCSRAGNLTDLISAQCIPGFMWSVSQWRNTQTDYLIIFLWYEDKIESVSLSIILGFALPSRRVTPVCATLSVYSALSIHSHISPMSCIVFAFLCPVTGSLQIIQWRTVQQTIPRIVWGNAHVGGSSHLHGIWHPYHFWLSEGLPQGLEDWEVPYRPWEGATEGEEGSSASDMPAIVFERTLNKNTFSYS